MNRFRVTILCCLLGGLLVWLGLRTVRADVATQPAPTTGLAGGGLASGDSGATQPAVAGAPGTQPSARDSIPIPPRVGIPIARAPLMTRPYMVLLNRSMFVRGHIAEQSHAGGTYVRPPPGPSPSLIREEAGLVFNGVTLTNSTIDALVEDTITGRVLTVHPGESVARGKVGKITMDSLEYIHDGRTTTIAIGQNFTGTEADVSSSPAASQPSSSGVSPQDMLEKLRQKRLQELGG